MAWEGLVGVLTHATGSLMCERYERNGVGGDHYENVAAMRLGWLSLEDGNGVVQLTGHRIPMACVLSMAFNHAFAAGRFPAASNTWLHRDACGVAKHA